MARRINDDGLAKIKGWEGFVPYPYDDADPKGVKGKTRIKTWTKDAKGRNIGPFGGVVTIGYGHTGTDIKPDMVWTEDHAAWVLRQDLAWAEKAVDGMVTVPLSEGQFAALVSFVLNVGQGRFRDSTLLKKLNAGDYAAVPGELNKYIYSMGKPNDGLKNRRAAEIGLWSKGSRVAGSAKPVEPKKSKSAPAVATGTATTGAAIAVNEAKDQLAPMADVPVIKYLVVALVVIGLALTAYGAYKRFKDAAP